VWGLHSLSHYLQPKLGCYLSSLSLKIIASHANLPVSSSNCELYTSLQLRLRVEATNTRLFADDTRSQPGLGVLSQSYRTGGHRILSLQPCLSFELEYTVCGGATSWRCRYKLNLVLHYRPVGLVSTSTHRCIHSSWRLHARCCQDRLQDNSGTTGQGKDKALWQQVFRGEVFNLVLRRQDQPTEFAATAQSTRG